jgi:hypothetical protein
MPSSGGYANNALGSLTVTGNVIDSAAGNFITTNTIAANSAPSISISPSSSSIQSGSTETFTITVTGGSGSFAIELYNVTGAKQQGSNTVIASPGSGTIAFVTGSTGTFAYNAIVTDKISSPYVTNSISSSITVTSGSSSSGNPWGTSGSGGNPGNPYPTTSSITSTSTTSSSTITTTIKQVQFKNVTSFQLNVNNSKLTIVNKSNGTVNTRFNLLNATAALPNPPNGFIQLYTVNVNSSFSVPSAISITTNFQCGISSSLVKPFLLQNSTWFQISPYSINNATCTETFNAPSKSKVGLFIGKGNVTITIVVPSTSLTTSTISYNSNNPNLQQTAIIVVSTIAGISIVAYILKALKIIKFI